MNVIEFNSVWKKFRKGEKLNSLRDMIPYLFRKALPGGTNGDLKQEEFWALKDVSFNVKKGEVIGIIGPNGAGKSTSLKLLAGIMKPNKGQVNIKGRLSALIEVTAGFHSELTGRENIYLNGTILGMTKKEIDSKFEEIVEFSGISEFIDTPVKRYSSGMFSRLGFSVAAHMDPEILLVDEVLSVGDIAFQAKCAQKMRELLNSGATIVLVSHNLSLIRSLCKRAILLDKGKIIKEGLPEEVIPFYENIVYRQREEELKKKLQSSPDTEYKVKIAEESLIKITNVLLYDEVNIQKEKFYTDELLNIKVVYETKETINNPVFSLEIIRPDGVTCCANNTREDNIDIKKINGKGSITIRLDNLNLAPGIYILKISVYNREMLNPYIIRNSDILSIQARTHIPPTNAIFLPKAKWSIV